MAENILGMAEDALHKADDFCDTGKTFENVACVFHHLFPLAH